jgi:hypothetical protein
MENGVRNGYAKIGAALDLDIRGRSSLTDRKKYKNEPEQAKSEARMFDDCGILAFPRSQDFTTGNKLILLVEAISISRWHVACVEYLLEGGRIYRNSGHLRKLLKDLREALYPC